jgi:hypothetical protein
MTGVTAAPELFPDAIFEGYEDFPHFENPTFPKCFFCNSRKMVVRPEVHRGYLMLPATMRLHDGRFKVIPGCTLVKPQTHCTDVQHLPDNWTACMKDALRHLEFKHMENILVYGLDPNEPPSYNITLNVGNPAGQTAGDLHEWVIQRGIFDEGLGANLGLATILVYLSQFGIITPQD